jgi:mono/diheme cytochrome c family protein
MKLAGLCFVAVGLFAACSDDNSGSSNSDDQTPPTSGRVDIEAWLSAGSYKAWAAEPAVHAFRDPSVHRFNRIYSNGVLAGAATGTAAWPKGAAAVKELYASATATTPNGYAVYLKTADDSAGGANWYWYERVAADFDAPKDANNVVADGMGGAGTAKSICVGCHGAAGSDPMHTPSTGGRDQVYTPVH